MGWSNTMAALSVPNLEVVALCDVDFLVLDEGTNAHFIRC
jgi:hypothetical protein